MKIILFGANGTIGKHVNQALAESGHEIIKVGKKTGDFQANIGDAPSLAALFKKIGSFDAVVNASGDVAFAPLEQISKDQWLFSFQSKLLGQINLVQQALPYINERGSFTLVSGILSEEAIFAGTAATVVNRAIEGFAFAAAHELPKNLRINVISPTVLEDSLGTYGAFFPGFTPVKGALVGQAFKKAVMGIQNGQTIRVG